MDTELALIGTSHQHAPLEIRERLAIPAEQATETARALAAACGEAVVLSTCARTEVYLSGRATAAAEEKATQLFQHRSRLPADQLRPLLYRKHDADAARHLLRVAAGLDSIVLGEGEILRQIRQAHAHGAPGPVLNALFRRALHSGKRTRTETRLGHRSVPLPVAAAEAVNLTLGGLDGKDMLMIGAGRISALCARELAQRGAQIAFIANRTLSRATPLARALGAEALTLDRIPEALGQVDAAISATSAPGTLITTDQIRRALQAKKGSPLCLVDLAIPRDIETTTNTLKRCTLHTLDQLDDARNRQHPNTHRAIAQATQIVDEEHHHFYAWWASRAAVPTITTLRAKAEEIRLSELARAEPKLRSLTPTQRQLVETITTQLVNKLLHNTTIRLKEASENPETALPSAAGAAPAHHA
jgi:glutamyl-tRNA reductase